MIEITYEMFQSLSLTLPLSITYKGDVISLTSYDENGFNILAFGRTHVIPWGTLYVEDDLYFMVIN